MNAIGLDIGTTTISAVVIDISSGEVLKSCTISNGADIEADIQGGKLQDPNVITEKVLDVIGELKSEYAPVCAIGVDGQMHGILYVDEKGNAVSPLYTWQDNRGSLSIGNESYAGRLSRLTGFEMATGFGLTTHYWLTINNGIPKDAVSCCTIFDYAVMKLTGSVKPKMHSSGAASFGLFDIQNTRWMVDEIISAGMDAAYLPEVTDGYVTVGTTADGIPVSCGIGDNQASFIGSVREPDSGILVNMGTGGQVSKQGFAGDIPDDLEMRPLGSGEYIIAGSMLCGGRAYAILEGFVRSVASLAGYDGEALYGSINRVAMESIDIENPWQVDTRFSGTRSDEKLRGSIHNIGIDNFDAAHLINGLIRGIVEEATDLYEKIMTVDPRKPEMLIGSGNGLRKNPALRKVFEKRFGLKMMIPKHNEEAAFGAALFALIASGVMTADEAGSLIHYM